MMRHRPRERRVGSGPGLNGGTSPLLLAWLLSRRRVDHGLALLLRFPRVLMALAALAGIALTALALRPIGSIAPNADVVSHSGAASGGTPTARAGGAAESELLVVIARYNQASIAAGLLVRPDLLAPYLAPEGDAWLAVQSEYERRRAQGETTDAALTRWGVLRIQVTDDTALVETQEQWDVVTSVGEEVIRSRRGVLTRNTYRLRRSPNAGWLIVLVESTTLIA